MLTKGLQSRAKILTAVQCKYPDSITIPDQSDGRARCRQADPHFRTYVYIFKQAIQSVMGQRGVRARSIVTYGCPCQTTAYADFYRFLRAGIHPNRFPEYALGPCRDKVPNLVSAQPGKMSPKRGLPFKFVTPLVAPGPGTAAKMMQAVFMGKAHGTVHLMHLLGN